MPHSASLSSPDTILRSTSLRISRTSRLHGPEIGKYQGSYSEERLPAWARQIETWAAKLKAVYVYFDNDQAGYAAANAITLKTMVFGTRVKKVV
jgi:uncharacterized protein YecE (DUF72 family)